jgi:hypothetical protein
MLRYDERHSNSELYARINALPLTAVERRIALSGLRDGEAVADAILSVVNGIKHLFAGAGTETGPQALRLSTTSRGMASCNGDSRS